MEANEYWCLKCQRRLLAADIRSVWEQTGRVECRTCYRLERSRERQAARGSLSELVAEPVTAGDVLAGVGLLGFVVAILVAAYIN